MHDERDDVAEIAVRDVQRGEEQAGAEGREKCEADKELRENAASRSAKLRAVEILKSAA